VVQRVSYQVVDVVEYGKKLGVDVVEVASVREAASYMLEGVNLSAPPAGPAPMPEELKAYLRERARSIASYALSASSEAAEAAQSALPLYRSALASLASSASSSARSALELAEEGDASYALVRALAAAQQATYALWLSKVLSGSLDVGGAFNETSSKIDSLRAKLEALKPPGELDLGAVDALAYAFSRLASAEGDYSKAASAAEQGDVAGALQLLSSAYWKCEAAEAWLGVLQLLPPELRAPASGERVKEVALVLYSIARDFYSYAYALSQDVGSQPSYLSDAEQALEAAGRLLAAGDYAGSLGASADASSYATLAVYELFATNATVVGGLAERAASEAFAALSSLGKALSPLPLFYYALGLAALRSGDYEAALLAFAKASLHAKKNLLIAGESSAAPRASAAEQKATAPGAQPLQQAAPAASPLLSFLAGFAAGAAAAAAAAALARRGRAPAAQQQAPAA